MADLKSPTLIHLKGWLFLVILLAASVAILYPFSDWRIALLLGLVIWSSARFYYYLFYVIEHYVDNQFKFASVFSAIRYLLAGGGNRRDSRADD
jgi:hypothetical protein